MGDISKIVIKCPNCKYEYLPAEIFYPQSVFGKPEHILRDNSGKIEYYEGTEMELSETYCCDKCGQTFRAVLNISCDSESLVHTDFDDCTTINLKGAEVSNIELW